MGCCLEACFGQTQLKQPLNNKKQPSLIQLQQKGMQNKLSPYPTAEDQLPKDIQKTGGQRNPNVQERKQPQSSFNQHINTKISQKQESNRSSRSGKDNLNNSFKLQGSRIAKQSNNLLVDLNKTTRLSQMYTSYLRQSRESRESRESNSSNSRLSSQMAQICLQVDQPNQNKDKIIQLIHRLFQKHSQSRLREQNAYDMAYLRSLLMNLSIENNQPQYHVQTHYKKALEIYQPQQHEYFEEIITIENNIAEYYSNLSDRKSKQQGIQHFNRAIEMLKKYTQFRDYRQLMIYNNLGCTLSQLGQFQQGNKYFKMCLENEDNNNTSLIRNIRENKQFYERAYQNERVYNKLQNSESALYFRGRTSRDSRQNIYATHL